ncbi:unnamed protein product [Nippostrongylus brasiliensis]|uniref:Uncharacterized protein n=1 Tax=Nippostrongylus brasiliensis TaxID=27835 RepID=A0A0N4YNG3_NIPBR|nr:unnamed protein product [Nippostrongylus brasiliensis]
MKFKKRGPRTLVNWYLFSSLASCWRDSAEENIDEEYNRFIAHIRKCAQGAESPNNTRKRLSHETVELIRQRGVARTEGNYLRTSELTKLCRGPIKEDLKERRVAVLVDAAEAGKSIRNARRGLVNYKTKMTALLRPDGTLTSSRRAMENVILDFYSDLFDKSWAFRKQDEHAICVVRRSIERRVLGVTRFIHTRDGIRSSKLRRQSKTRDAVARAKLSKIRSPTSAQVGLFVKTLNDRFDALRVPRASRNHWSTTAYDREEWRRYWCPREQIDDQRNDR